MCIRDRVLAVAFTGCSKSVKDEALEKVKAVDLKAYMQEDRDAVKEFKAAYEKEDVYKRQISKRRAEIRALPRLRLSIHTGQTTAVTPLSTRPSEVLCLRMRLSTRHLANTKSYVSS